jgi:phosphoribosylamine--glycine ligase
VFVAPGNGGTALDGRLENMPSPMCGAARMGAGRKDRADGGGPRGAAGRGVVDEFRAHGLRIFGPTKAAAQLESSKAFSKAFMKRHGIPTADYDTFTDPAAAHAYVDRWARPSSSRPTAWRPARAWWWP